MNQLDLLNCQFNEDLISDIILYHKNRCGINKDIDIKFISQRKNQCRRHTDDSFTIEYSKVMFDINPVYALYVAIHELCHVAEFNHSVNHQQLVDQELSVWDVSTKYARVYPYEYYYEGKLACGPNGGLPTKLFTVGKTVNVTYRDFQATGQIVRKNKMTLGFEVYNEDEAYYCRISPALISRQQECIDGDICKETLCQTLHREVLT